MGEPERETPLDRYRRVMGPTDLDLDSKAARFTVRQWDGMDGCWCDCHGAIHVDIETALGVWMTMTDHGTRRVRFDEIDYYRIFPAETRMHWDGSAGREMFRGNDG